MPAVIPPESTTIPPVSAPVSPLGDCSLSKPRVEAHEPSGRPGRHATPRQAIHCFCVECQGSAVEANRCHTTLCEVWPHRKSKRDPGAPHTPCKSIRLRCLDCVDQHPGSVRVCEITNCPLWPFRMGRNPNIRRRKTGEA